MSNKWQVMTWEDGHWEQHSVVPTAMEAQKLSDELLRTHSRVRITSEEDE
ncbi:MAG: hypothetical protein K0M69_15860 [Youngiibacter sp.]|nr:hypothetical protein [Youngiibacter sp.]